MSKSKVKCKPLSYSLGTTKDPISSRPGLLTLVKVLQALKLGQQANRLFPPPESNEMVVYRNRNGQPVDLIL